MEEKRQKEDFVLGNKVKYDEDLREAFLYLDSHLNRDFAEVFFYAAKGLGRAPFETNYSKKYVLVYERDFYLIERYS